MDRVLASPRVIERRRTCRFTTSRQVLVRLPHGSIKTSTANVSTGGLLLVPSPALNRGEQLKFTLELQDGEPAVEFCAALHTIDASGAHVVFADEHAKLAARIRRWIESSLLPELERRIGGSRDDTRDVIEWAAWQRQTGRIEASLELFRAASDTRPRGLAFQEQRARCLVEALAQPGADRSALARELVDTTEQGLALGSSELLTYIKSDVIRAEVIAVGVEPSAQSESEVARLRESIRVERAGLYAGFRHLLAETAKMEALERASGSFVRKAFDTTRLPAQRRPRVGAPRLVPRLLVALALASLLSAAPAAKEARLAESPAFARVTALAAEQLQACAAMSRRSPEAHLALGVAYGLLGNEQAALSAFERFMVLAPRHRDVAAARTVANQLRRTP